MINANWVHVYTAAGESEAIVLRSYLESEGIQVKTFQESVGKMYSISVDGLGAVKIFVKDDNAKRAAQIIKSREE